MGSRPEEPAREPGARRIARQPTCVAGIGASAGCLPALKELFAHVPARTGIAYVVVVHLSPEHESRLAEMLQPASRMPVRQVTRTMALEPDTVYVIPPNANLSAVDSHLRLSALEEERRDRAPIDHFLRTMATTHNGTAVGVILTGAGSDGALGLRWIREHGGLAIAQDPAEAAVDGMPQSAIAAGAVDIVARVADIGAAIARFCAARPRLPEAADGGLPEPERGTLDEIVAELRRATGHEAGGYRPAVLLKRIARRMQIRNVETLADYLAALRRVPGEPSALLADLSLTVPEFFGDPAAFACLEHELVPHLFEAKRGPGDRIRTWAIGCSTGEMAYSLAILLLEEAERRSSRSRIKVFASDLSEANLACARAAVYPEEIAATVSPERLARFFRHEDGHYRVSREVSDLVVFARHDVLRDPPFPQIDLVLCRHFLRDLEPAAQRDALGQFAYALESRGYLLLGAGELIEESPLFLPEDGPEHEPRDEPGEQKVALYRRRPSAVRRPLDLLAPVKPPREDELSETALHARLSELHGPPSVLLDAEHRVTNYSTRVGRYVRLPGGEPTRDILRLVSPSLRSALAAGLARIALEQRPWSSRPLVAETDEGPLHVTLRLVPAGSRGGADVRHTLLFFEELEAPRARFAHRESDPATSMARLSLELERARGRLEAWNLNFGTAREGEAAGPGTVEFRDVEDELRAAAETLQATEEELQATNEELLTLDAENRRQIEELGELTSDLRHLLAATGIATLFLDRELAIVRFTPPASELLRLRQTDRGRPLADLAHGLRYPELAADAERVLASLEQVEREVEGPGGRWYLARLLPYRTTAETVAGTVLSLIDVTERRRAEEELRAADRRKDEFLATLAHELRNPLAPIVSGIGVLRIAGGSPRVLADVTATMERQARQLVRLVDDLLEVSRIAGGRLQLQRQAVDLADVLRDATAAVRPLLEAAEHELVVRPPAEPIVLHADPARLGQVLANLLSNAARYTPAHGHVSLSAERVDDEAVIVVEDDGMGIPADMLQRIFEPFTQLAAARQTPTSGLGIGLALARSLVEMHGGRIGAASAGPGRGSEFTVRLPIPAAAPDESAGDGNGGAATPERSVLVVDDNADAAHTLALLLGSLGLPDVRTATDGARALRAAAERPPEVMLVDLRMPDVDGFEVARRVRAEPWGRGTVLVALSGWGQEEHRRRAREAGFDRYLTKPAGEAALLEVLALRPAAREA